MSNHSVSNNKMFLATTAIEDFWDGSEKTLFLGEWCQLYSRKQHWESMDYILLSSPYGDKDSGMQKFDEVKAVYTAILPPISKALNNIHQTNLSLKAWEILLGPWLMHYLPAVYDRLLHINHAYKSYDNLVTITLDSECFITCSDTFESVMSLKHDHYNLQIFSQLIQLKKIKSRSKKYNIERKFKSTSEPVVHKVVACFTRLLKLISDNLFNDIAFRYTHLPKSVEIKFVLKYFGRIFPAWNKETIQPIRTADYVKREAFSYMEVGDTEFEQCIKKMLRYDMPLCFVENLNYNEKTARRLYPHKVKNIFSASAWYFDETFKYWAATSAENGARLIGAQHGGSYGSYVTFAELHELSLTDVYYSWGWQSPGNSNIVPMPAVKLLRFKQAPFIKQVKRILWLGTSNNRYLIEYPFLSRFNNEYLDWQWIFFDALKQGVAKLVVHRPHYESYSKGTVDKIKALAPQLTLESWQTEFQESVQSSQLIVCDHNSTTFLETLSSNYPTILFWNPLHYKLFETAKPYYDLLNDVGVLFYSPEKAAKAVEEACIDIEAWWSEPKRQAAVKTFSEQFAKTSEDAVKIWDNELAELLKT